MTASARLLTECITMLISLNSRLQFKFSPLSAPVQTIEVNSLFSGRTSCVAATPVLNSLASCLQSKCKPVCSMSQRPPQVKKVPFIPTCTRSATQHWLLLSGLTEVLFEVFFPLNFLFFEVVSFQKQSMILQGLIQRTYCEADITLYAKSPLLSDSDLFFLA